MWLPRRLARRSLLAGTVAADGHHLAVWPGVGVLLPLVAGAGGVAAGWLRPGYATSPTESVWLLVGVAALGCLLAQAGAWFAAGFVAGDLAGLPAWTLEVPADAAGLLADPVAAGVVFLVAPRVVVWLLVALLAVGVPVAARGLTRSVAVRLRSTPGVDLSVAALCVAVAGYVLARLWGAAAAPAVRPVFTFLPPWDTSRIRVPAEAIEPVQASTVVPKAVVVAMLLRAVLVWLVSTRRPDRLAQVEARLLEALPGGGPGTTGGVFGAVGAGAAGTLLVAGLLDDWRLAVVVAVALTVLRAARTGLLPVPTVRFRGALARVPLALRFAVGLLVVHALTTAMVGAAWQQGSPESFQPLVWPVLAGVAVLTLLLADPARRSTAPRQPPGAGGPEGWLLVAATAALWVAGAAAGWADNCGTPADCYPTADAAAAGLLGVVGVIALSALIDLSPLGWARSGAELATGVDVAHRSAPVVGRAADRRGARRRRRPRRQVRRRCGRDHRGRGGRPAGAAPRRRDRRRRGRGSVLAAAHARGPALRPDARTPLPGQPGAAGQRQGAQQLQPRRRDRVAQAHPARRRPARHRSPLHRRAAGQVPAKGPRRRYLDHAGPLPGAGRRGTNAAS